MYIILLTHSMKPFKSNPELYNNTAEKLVEKLVASCCCCLPHGGGFCTLGQCADSSTGSAVFPN